MLAEFSGAAAGWSVIGVDAVKRLAKPQSNQGIEFLFTHQFQQGAAGEHNLASGIENHDTGTAIEELTEKLEGSEHRGLPARGVGRAGQNPEGCGFSRRALGND
jgi:hypothetical protein